MTIEITLPALSPTMEKGNLAKWLVKVGDVVKSGDLLAEIETDKATMEYEATDGGVIARILVPEGTDDVPVGSVIALMGALGDPRLEPAPPPPVAAQPSPSPVESPPQPAGTPQPTPLASPLPVAPPKTPLPSELKISPLARRIANAAGVDLASVKGSGANGKILRADLGLPDRSPPQGAPSAASPVTEPTASNYPTPDTPFIAVKLSTMRKTIARRLTVAKQTVPHFYLGVDVRIEALLALRGDLNTSLAHQSVKLSVNDFLIKALGVALEEVPDANVQFADDELYRFARADVSVAVAIPGGLITPVIRDAANKRLTRISSEVKALASRAKEGKLAPEEYQGGTASLSNLGMFGMKDVVPVINPPQALILGVGAAEERPYTHKGELAVGSFFTATLSVDHRAIDGAVAAGFLSAFKRLVENPAELLA